jgi:two-component system NtrC family sensor kinase
MTDTLHEREVRDPVEPGRTRAQPGADRAQAPPEPSPRLPNPARPHGSGWLQRRLARFSIGHLVSAVGLIVAILFVASFLAFATTVSWLHATADDNTEWAAVAEQLETVDDLADKLFLYVMQGLHWGEGDPAEIEARSAEIERETAKLVELVATMASDPRLDEATADLAAGNDMVRQYGIDVVTALHSGNEELVRASLSELEVGYQSVRRDLGTLSEIMREAQSAKLELQSERATLALRGLAVGGTVTLLLLFAGGLLGRQMRRREAALQEQLAEEKHLLGTIVDCLPDSITWKDPELRMLGCNSTMAGILATEGVAQCRHEKMSALVQGGMHRTAVEVEEVEAQVLASATAAVDHEMRLPDGNGGNLIFTRTVVPLLRGDEVIGVVSMVRDITEIVDMERSLASARQLESIGRLAAGVAHEINTPVQFVSDNIAFLDESLAGLFASFSALSDIARGADPETVDRLVAAADLEFLIEEIPDAISQSREGVAHIARIVRAMKDFAHPGRDLAAADVNRLIESTVEISRNEWKYVADLDLELDPALPPIRCNEGQIKQVLLNMIINAAHAIADRGAGDGAAKGRITIGTAAGDNGIRIRISDTGAGMTEETQRRVFEPFFTTKEVGRGTGQGLAIAHDVITAHGGVITVQSVVGTGTTFVIDLPLEASVAATD